MSNINEELKNVLRLSAQQFLLTDEDHDVPWLVNFVQECYPETVREANASSDDISSFLQECLNAEERNEPVRANISSNLAHVMSQGHQGRPNIVVSSPTGNSNDTSINNVTHSNRVLPFTRPNLKTEPERQPHKVSPQNLHSKIKEYNVIDMTDITDSDVEVDTDNMPMMPVANGDNLAVEQNENITLNRRERNRGCKKSAKLDELLKEVGFNSTFFDRHGEILNFVNHHSDNDQLTHHKQVVQYLETAFGVQIANLDHVPDDINDLTNFFGNHRFLECHVCPPKDSSFVKILLGVHDQEQAEFCQDNPFLTLILLDCKIPDSTEENKRKRIAVVYNFAGRIVFPCVKNDFYVVSRSYIEDLKRRDDGEAYERALDNICQKIRKVGNRNFPIELQYVGSFLIKKKSTEL